MIVADLSCC